MRKIDFSLVFAAMSFLFREEERGRVRAIQLEQYFRVENLHLSNVIQFLYPSIFLVWFLFWVKFKFLFDIFIRHGRWFCIGQWIFLTLVNFSRSQNVSEKKI